MAPGQWVSVWHRWVAFVAMFCIGLLLVAPAAAQQIQVTSANPASAEQGTVNLNVTVGGKGFKSGAAARFVLTGTDNPDGISVNSTTFVNSSTVVANITVADTATISKFDIKVSNKDGRIGKGTELFAVLAKGSGNQDCSPCTNEDVPVVSVLEMLNPATSAPFHIHEDGGGAYIGYSLVGTGKRADFLLSRIFGGTGDWVVDTNTAKTYPRSVYIDLRDGTGPIDAELVVPVRALLRCVLDDDPATSDDEGTWSDGGLLVMKASLPKKTNCRLGVGFTYGGTSYALQIGPHQSGDAAWVTCTSFTTGGNSCNSWQIEAGTYDPVLNPSGNPGKVAWLLRRDPHSVETKVGEYNVSFRFQVTRQ